MGRGLALLALCAAALFSLPARADTRYELSGSVGFGPVAAGAGSSRFAIVPTASFLVLLGERWLLRCDDGVTLLGAAGGRFGVANTTTLAFGARWETVNVNAGFSLAEYSVPLCGAFWCDQSRGLAPGIDARVDMFLPGVLREALGLSANCGMLWIVGEASAAWRGLSTRCTLGPILRLSSR